MDYLLARKQDDKVSQSINCWTEWQRAAILYYLFIYLLFIYLLNDGPNIRQIKFQSINESATVSPQWIVCIRSEAMKKTASSLRHSKKSNLVTYIYNSMLVQARYNEIKLPSNGFFYIHVTVQGNKFPYNKTNYMH
jgi:hypothetical protein